MISLSGLGFTSIPFFFDDPIIEKSAELDSLQQSAYRAINYVEIANNYAVFAYEASSDLTVLKAVTKDSTIINRHKNQITTYHQATVAYTINALNALSGKDRQRDLPNFKTITSDFSLNDMYINNGIDLGKMFPKKDAELNEYRNELKSLKKSKGYFFSACFMVGVFAIIFEMLELLKKPKSPLNKTLETQQEGHNEN